MRRRDFITLIGGAAAWPLAAHSQQGERVRRIGVLNPAAADNAVFQARIGAFQQELALLGWTIGGNVRIDIRWATKAAEMARQHTIDEAKKRILLTLKKRADLTRIQLCEYVRGKKQIFNVALDEVVDAGVVSREPHGRTVLFRLTEVPK